MTRIKYINLMRRVTAAELAAYAQPFGPDWWIKENRQNDVKKEESNEKAQGYIQCLKKLKDPVVNTLLKEVEQRHEEDSLLLPVTELLYQLFKKGRQEQKKLNHRITILEKENLQLKNKLNGLRGKYTQKQKKATLESIRQCSEKTTVSQVARIFLERHMEVLQDNDNRPESSWRFPDDLRPFYVLFSFAGEYWYNVIRTFFGFPTHTLY